MSFVFSSAAVIQSANGEVKLRTTYKSLYKADQEGLKNLLIGKFSENQKDGRIIDHNYKLKTIDGGKVVIDNFTGLMWHQSGSTGLGITWQKAEEWVKKLNGVKFKDGRMVRECYSSPSRLSEMSFKDKRRLMELAFGSKDFKKNKLGVRIEQGSTEKAFKFTIRGQFSNHPDYREQISGELPESLAGIQEALRIDPYYEADYNPFDEVEIKKAQFKKKNRQKAHSRRGKVKSVCQHIVLPPSTVKQLPVTKSDQSEA